MVSGDILAILFRDIFRMAQYPGAPFTGEAIYDLVSFFLVPTVFIIAVIYWTLGIVLRPGQGHTSSIAILRLLVGITAYLYIIVNGYYGTFALIAGPYFFFLFVVMGLIFYLAAHFKVSHHGALQSEGMLDRRNRLKELDEEIAEANRHLKESGGSHGSEVWAAALLKLENERNELRRRGLFR